MENVSIHDNIINAYTVDLGNEVISFETTSESAQRTTITFREVLAHRFEDVIKNSILLDIMPVTISYFINDYKDRLIQWFKYGFPTSSRDCEELEKFLNEKEYMIFIIQSSLGLNGFIIAKSMEFNN